MYLKCALPGNKLNGINLISCRNCLLIYSSITSVTASNVAGRIHAFYGSNIKLKLRDSRRKIKVRSQSYNRDLQSRRCENLQSQPCQNLQSIGCQNLQSIGCESLQRQRCKNSQSIRCENLQSQHYKNSQSIGCESLQSQRCENLRRHE
jgi:hypothetical protein